jgi:hypothetical protein
MFQMHKNQLMKIQNTVPLSSTTEFKNLWNGYNVIIFGKMRRMDKGRDVTSVPTILLENWGYLRTKKCVVAKDHLWSWIQTEYLPMQQV